MERLSQLQANRIVAQLERDGVIKRPKPRERRRKRRELMQSRLKACDLPGEAHKVNPTEGKFAGLVVVKGGRLFRNGWPDFLVELPDRTIGVEVKRANDAVFEEQAKMFAALNRVGLEVFIWNPRFPDKLTPWRKYMLR